MQNALILEPSGDAWLTGSDLSQIVSDIDHGNLSVKVAEQFYVTCVRKHLENAHNGRLFRQCILYNDITF